MTQRNRKYRKYTKAVLEEAVSASTSMANVLRYFGLKQTGGNWSAMQARLRVHAVDVSHMRRQGWSKGLTSSTSEAVRRNSLKRRSPDDVVFSENSPYIWGSEIKRKLIQDYSWVYACSICSITDWLGAPLALHLDHINGVHNDNRLENLRFLCPNCHQQTPTWGSKNISKRSEEQTLCLGCSRPISHKRADRCKSCAGKVRGNNKIRWPDVDVLQKMVDDTSYLATGKALGVSDNAVRKRLRNHGAKRG